MDKNIFHPISQSRLQGGISFPLLANIALCDLEAVLGTVPNKIDWVRGNRVDVRYTDDFVVLCSSLKVARTTQIEMEIATWLKTKNLNLTRDKTRIVHIDEGFDFLDVNIRHFKTNVKTKTQNKKGLLIRPNKKSIEKIKEKLRNK